MKKRILFVDDDDMLLRGLERMLRPMRENWEMEFVNSGAGALDRMAKRAFDAVVSDMSMPGMNGAELMNEVMARYPSTVRLMFSGQEDKDLIMRCVGATHQYIAKPCNSDELKATIARATSLNCHINNEPLRQLVARVGRLPSMPSLYLELTKLLKNEDIPVEEIGAVISRDIAMTAKILKLVNSAFFGLRRELSTPAEATAYLGVEIIKALSLALNVFSQLDSVTARGFSVEELWRHSMEVATGARQLAILENADIITSNQSFTAGILHDAGLLVLASNFPDDFGEMTDRIKVDGVDEMAAEREVFGATHVEVGGYLFGLWGLPVPVVEAIALHREPGKCSEKRFGALTAVHVANALLAESGRRLTPGNSPPVDENYLQELGLLERLPVWRGELAHNQS